MKALYEDPQFTFRFAEDRIIPRFHLEGVPAGQRVAVFRINVATNERLGLLATARVGEGGWVDLAEPIRVRAGEAFIAVLDAAYLTAEEKAQVERLNVPEGEADLARLPRLPPLDPCED